MARPEERKFLGFSIANDGSERRIALKALARFKAQVRDMTRRTRGIRSAYRRWSRISRHTFADGGDTLASGRPHECSPTWRHGSDGGYVRIFGGNGKTAPTASRNCGAVACRSSTRRLPPARRPGSGACPDTTGPAQPVFPRPRSSPPLCSGTSLTRSNRRGTAGGVGGAMPRGVPLSRSMPQSGHHWNREPKLARLKWSGGQA